MNEDIAINSKSNMVTSLTKDLLKLAKDGGLRSDDSNGPLVDPIKPHTVNPNTIGNAIYRRHMSNCNCLWKLFRIISLSLILGMNMSACAVGNVSSWKEEALLHDGTKLIVQRKTERAGRHEIGQRPPFANQSLTFNMPSSGQKIIWEDTFSEDLGSASFLPMMLDILNGKPYLLSTPAGCLSYNKWGRPNPPYVIFQYQGNEWQRITLDELPAEFNHFNLIISSPDQKAQEGSNHGLVSAEKIQELNSSARQPEFQTVLRAEVKGGGQEMCPPLIRTGDGWKSYDWFKNQPTLERCQQVCTKEKVDSQNCPCTSLFKGK